MPDHDALVELVKISEAIRDALREAYELARAGENGEPLREALHFARDLLDLANETLAGDPQAGEHTRGMSMYMAEQLAAVEGLLGPMAAA
jgi:hypothetical protein